VIIDSVGSSTLLAVPMPISRSLRRCPGKRQPCF
jgi:hypothetical protein